MGKELANKATAVTYMGKRNNRFEGAFLAEFRKNKSGDWAALIFSTSVNVGVCWWWPGLGKHCPWRTGFGSPQGDWTNHSSRSGVKCNTAEDDKILQCSGRNNKHFGNELKPKGSEKVKARVLSWVIGSLSWMRYRCNPFQGRGEHYICTAEPGAGERDLMWSAGYNSGQAAAFIGRITEKNQSALKVGTA